MCLAVYPLQLERSPSLFLFKLASSCLMPSHSVYFQAKLSLFHHGSTSPPFPLLPEPIRCLPFSIWGLFPSSFYSLQLINLAGLIRGTVWHKSIHSVTGNTHKYDSCIAFKMHLQLFSSAHVEHVSYCQSRRIWVETLKAERRSLVTVLLQHLHTVTHRHKHTHFSYFLSSALMPPPHQTWSQSGSRVLGRRTKTLPVSCMWMDLIRWWFNLGVCGASESAASWLWALMSSAKNYLRRKISVHESGWGKKKKNEG